MVLLPASQVPKSVATIPESSTLQTSQLYSYWQHDNKHRVSLRKRNLRTSSNKV